MKLPTIFEKFLPHETQQTLMFLSLAITPEDIEGAVWHAGHNGKTVIDATAREKVAADSWEERIIASDKVLGKLEEAVPGTTLSKVVLGLPSDYLTETGDIEADVRPEIKKLTKELELSAIGFVSIHQALMHKLKLDEGVPPSVIFLNVKSDGLTVYLYKVGNLMGEKSIGRQEPTTDLEAVFKSFKELEVLPSRILLYGGNPDESEEIKRLLLKHPWPTRANFLHFPKIEILPVGTMIEAVSLAGSNETKADAVLEGAFADVHAPEEKVIAQPELGREEVITPEAEEVFAEEKTETTEAEVGEESNIQMVEPEALGFRKSEDILEESQKLKVESQKSDEYEKENEEEKNEEEEKPDLSGKKPVLPFKMPAFNFSGLAAGAKLFSLRGMAVPLAGAVIIIFFLAFVFYWFAPHATVTILESTKSVSETASVTIDPTATIADPGSKIIPGINKEQSESGEKVIATTGKKQVGDPAKGAVTIYNKDTGGSKAIPKGSILKAGSLQFTLDSDIAIASASENLAQSSTTYGKTTGNITAAALGTQGNLPAGTDFVFEDFSSGTVVARNDQPLAGGTSKNITVVSRDDYDNLTKALTDELVKKAQTDLQSSVSGHQKLITDTVKATVAEKNFTEEIGQESAQLHGKLSVSVSGLSYNEDDITALMKGLTGGKLPPGFNFVLSQTQIKISKIQVKKDGTVAATINFSSAATPTFDLPDIQKKISGKSVRAAQDYLKTVTGVRGVEFDFSWNIFGNRLPTNPKNISISVAI